LIEGLDGGATDDDGSGIIRLDNLKNYLYNELKDMGRQTPHGLFATDLENVRFAKCPKIYQDNIDRNMKEGRKYLDTENIFHLFSSLSAISNILEIHSDYEEAIGLKKEIKKHLESYQSKIVEWLSDNMHEVGGKTKYIYPQLETLVDKNLLDIEKIQKLDKKTRNLVILLCRVSDDKISTATFIKFCKPYDNPSPQTPGSPISSKSLKGPIG
jgi:hypothetical protein